MIIKLPETVKAYVDSLKKHYLKYVDGILACIIFLGIGAYMFTRHPVSSISFERIEIGSSKSEIEDILAGPAKPRYLRLEIGDDRWARGILSRYGQKFLGLTCGVWRNEEVSILVFFDEQDRVVEKTWERRDPLHIPDPFFQNSFQKLKRWLGFS